MKLSGRSGQIVFVVLLAFFMSAAVTLALLFIRGGYAPGFMMAWLRQWTIAFVVAAPTGIVVLPLVRRVVDFLCR